MHFFIWKLIQTFSLYLSIWATFHTIPNSWDCLQAIKYEMVHKMSVKIQSHRKNFRWFKKQLHFAKIPIINLLNTQF